MTATKTKRAFAPKAIAAEAEKTLLGSENIHPTKNCLARVVESFQPLTAGIMIAFDLPTGSEGISPDELGQALPVRLKINELQSIVGLSETAAAAYLRSLIVKEVGYAPKVNAIFVKLPAKGISVPNTNASALFAALIKGAKNLLSTGDILLVVCGYPKNQSGLISKIKQLTRLLYLPMRSKRALPANVEGQLYDCGFSEVQSFVLWPEAKSAAAVFPLASRAARSFYSTRRLQRMTGAGHFSKPFLWMVSKFDTEWRLENDFLVIGRP